MVALTNRENHFETMFENHTPIGRGSFAEVYSVTTKDTKEKFAIKKKKKPFRGLQDRERAIRELSTGITLSKNRHPHIVHYILGWEEKGYLYIQTELCERTLQDYLIDTEIIEEDEIWGFLLDISLGLFHIQKNQFVHLDIKPGNILISFDGLSKIGDFGLTINPDLWRRDEDSEGDSRYMAPELFRDDETCDAGNSDPVDVSFYTSDRSDVLDEEVLKPIYPDIEDSPKYRRGETSSIIGIDKIGYEADVFSLGATIFQLASNITDMPKSGDSWQYLRSGNLSLQSIPNAPKRSRELQNIINRMMHPDPKKRITVTELLNLPRLKLLLQHRQRSGIYGSFNMLEYVYGVTRRRSKSRSSAHPDPVEKVTVEKIPPIVQNIHSATTIASPLRRCLGATKSDPDLRKYKHKNESELSFTISSAVGSNFDTSMSSGRRNLFGMEVEPSPTSENKVSHATKRPALQMEVDTDVTMADADSIRPKIHPLSASSPSSINSSDDRPGPSPDILQDVATNSYMNSPTLSYNTRAGSRKLLHRKSKSGDVRHLLPPSFERESGNREHNNTHGTNTGGNYKRRERGFSSESKSRQQQISEIYHSSLQAIPNDTPPTTSVTPGAAAVPLATDAFPPQSNLFIPRKIDFNVTFSLLSLTNIIRMLCDLSFYSQAIQLLLPCTQENQPSYIRE